MQCSAGTAFEFCTLKCDTFGQIVQEPIPLLIDMTGGACRRQRTKRAIELLGDDTVREEPLKCIIKVEINGDAECRCEILFDSLVNGFEVLTPDDFFCKHTVKQDYLFTTIRNQFIDAGTLSKRIASSGRFGRVAG